MGFQKNRRLETVDGPWIIGPITKFKGYFVRKDEILLKKSDNKEINIYIVEKLND